ncbi:MAG: hypothetical protein R3F39_09510 [Myxococcota bacterium]
MSQRFPRFLLALSLVLTMSALSACGASKLDADGYKKASAGLDGSIKQVERETHDALTTGDPMMLGRAFETLVPKLVALREQVKKIQVGDAAMAEAHAGLVSTVDAYVGEFERLNETVTSAVLADTKASMRTTVEEFEAGIATWRDAIGE